MKPTRTETRPTLLLCPDKNNKSRARSHQEDRDKQVHQVGTQKVGVPCSHTTRTRSVPPPIGTEQWLTMRPAISDRLKEDSHTHMKQPGSFVNTSTLSSRQNGFICVGVCACVCSCALTAVPWPLGNKAQLHTNYLPPTQHSCVSHPFFFSPPNTCRQPGETFQHTVSDRQDRGGLLTDMEEGTDCGSKKNV